MMNNSPWLDGALYPDVDIPDALETLPERVDFLARLCAAWDFGLLPDAGTITEIRKENWYSAVDACRLLTSPAYHLLRRWHGLYLSPIWVSRLRSFETIPVWFRCEEGTGDRRLKTGPPSSVLGLSLPHPPSPVLRLLSLLDAV